LPAPISTRFGINASCPQRTTRAFGYLSLKRQKIPGLIALAWPFVIPIHEQIFREDEEIMNGPGRPRRAELTLEQ
jgi:hypothetical protein